MPSTFPGSPKLLKGALVAFESQFLGSVPNVIVFQYNPAQLSRSLETRAAMGEQKSIGTAREDTYRVEGPPVETIQLTVELDAADQPRDAAQIVRDRLEEVELAVGDRRARLEVRQEVLDVMEAGLHPAIAALELLLYPPEASVQQLRAQAQSGTVQQASFELPLVLFVWGKERVLPVRLTSFSITEQAFDPLLNPIRAEVSLGLRVLTHQELFESSLGYGAYMAMQVQKEALARRYMINQAAGIIDGLLPF